MLEQMEVGATFEIFEESMGGNLQQQLHKSWTDTCFNNSLNFIIRAI